MAFDDLMGRLDHPMVVVTTAAGEARAGCLVGFHAQCGMEPPAYAVWLSKANHTYRVGVLAETFAVHFLGEEDRPLAVLFGTTSGDTVDAFERCAWVEGPDGVPVLEQVADRFVGRRRALLDVGDDHVCLVLGPIDAHIGDGALLGLTDVVDLQAGHDATERQRPDGGAKSPTPPAGGGGGRRKGRSRGGSRRSANGLSGGGIPGANRDQYTEDSAD